MPSQPQQRPPVPLRLPSLSRQRVPVEDDAGSWPITFSDLVLLLLCFFVLYHVAEKQQAAKTPPPEPAPPPVVQLAEIPPAPPQTMDPTPVEPPPPAPSQTMNLTPVEPPPPAPEPQKLETVSAPQPQADPTPQAAPPQERQEPQEAVTPGWQETLQAQLDEYVRTHGLGNAVGVISTTQGVMLSLSETVTFPSGRATLSPAVAPLLEQVAALAQEKADLDIEITGHTDDRQIATAEFPSNWELSAARASRVARALLEQQRVDPTRISTRGYASYRPLYPNDTEEHRAANRRVELRFFQRIETVY